MLIDTSKKPTMQLMEILQDAITTEVPAQFFSLGNLIVLHLNGRFISLWQDAKGQICYRFNFTDTEYYSTTIKKAGNVLSQYFQRNVEVVDNPKDSWKKLSTTASMVNKSISDSEYFNNYLYPLQQPYNNTQNNQMVSNSYQVDSLMVQKHLHQDIVTLSVYQHQANLQTYFVALSELFIVHKAAFRPDIKYTFFMENNSLCLNTYTPSLTMLEPPVTQIQSDMIHNSFILKFIKSVTNNPTQALQIIFWIAHNFNITTKLDYALVIYSQENDLMQLLWEEIIEPLLNPHYCQEISNKDLNQKSLTSLLDKKVIYRFHNITSNQIMDAPSKEFLNRLIHKNEFKFNSNNKTITSVANTLITSTTKYIPLIAQDVPYVLVELESDIKEVCRQLHMPANSGYYDLVKRINNDIYNFAHILKWIDLNYLYNVLFNQQHIVSTAASKILDGDTDILQVFEASIKNKDITFFQSLKTKHSKLYKMLTADFKKDRISRPQLIHYFNACFGSGIYTRNELIAALRELSTTNEPFENKSVQNINGNVYYRL